MRHRIRGRAAAVAVALVASATFACPRAGADTLEDRLSASVHRWQRTSGGHAVSATIRIPGRDYVWEGAAGDVRQNWPATTDTLYRVGSATKTFTATLALQLVDEGRISLDDPLSRWYPQYPNAPRITVRNLLQHTSGIKELPLDDAVFLAISALQPWRNWLPEQLIAWSASPLPYYSFSMRKLIDRRPDPPGTLSRTSQTNYFLLGRIIEKVTDTSYADALKSRITEPLGLDHTLMPATGDDPFMPAWSHVFNLLPFRLPTTVLPSYNAPWSATWTAAGIVSTTGDLVRFHEAVESGELLSPEAVAAMHTTVPMDPVLPGTAHYGLGLYLNTIGTHTTWGHDGGVPGFATMNRFEPSCGVYLVVMTNADDDPLPPAGQPPAPNTRRLAELGKQLLDTVDDAIGCLRG